MELCDLSHFLDEEITNITGKFAGTIGFDTTTKFKEIYAITDSSTSAGDYRVLPFLNADQ